VEERDRAIFSMASSRRLHQFLGFRLRSRQAAESAIRQFFKQLPLRLQPQRMQRHRHLMGDALEELPFFR